jgi:hypothetical protein
MINNDCVKSLQEQLSELANYRTQIEKDNAERLKQIDVVINQIKAILELGSLLVTSTKSVTNDNKADGLNNDDTESA